MNVPKGNAVALQALKPIENKTADILSGYVFELIKQKKADDAARAKQIADSNKTWFDAYKDLKVDPTVTAKMYQDTSNKLFLETKDLVSKAGMLSQDPNLSEQEKIKAIDKLRGKPEMVASCRAISGRCCCPDSPPVQTRRPLTLWRLAAAYRVLLRPRLVSQAGLTNLCQVRLSDGIARAHVVVAELADAFSIERIGKLPA